MCDSAYALSRSPREASHCTARRMTANVPCLTSGGPSRARRQAAGAAVSIVDSADDAFSARRIASTTRASSAGRSFAALAISMECAVAISHDRGRSERGWSSRRAEVCVGFQTEARLPDSGLGRTKTGTEATSRRRAST
ncbi:uncharacterized protein MICPUCDRAFT_56209 [Micromonas pusilla CCMP1545]|uniref:Predicted protein n=1 Tax=Micromonas pusilla (strain CCMP1545) TaxID=564608 RepID=C1MPA9_MICPC|nr:uncharacterized protein MICPUCDRAFT_56209 [Micromonas pusilla CCMP1545]EEH58433.1 predicted protein [Micromonas pusilla CCMP1545]|eukprot:XP_003056788.1 predicted protein [Micromonas pusilla CCMP1545]